MTAKPSTGSSTKSNVISLPSVSTAKPNALRGEWIYGYWRKDARGKRKYYIRESRQGRRWDFSTGTSTESAAEKEYYRWASDPDGWAPLGSDDRLELTEALIAQYLSWVDGKAMEHGRVPDAQWRRAKERHLGWWKKKLAGRNLAALKLSVILDALAGVTDRAKRAVVIKHLFTFLAQTARITAAQNPTGSKALAVAPSRSAQDRGVDKIIPGASIAAVIPLLPERLALLLQFQAATGAHVSEALRFIESGTVDGNVIGFAHKGGHIHRLAVDEGVASLASKLISPRTRVARETYSKAVTRACKASGVPRFTVGTFRHTFATAAVQAGAVPSAVSAALGHRSEATMRKFYSTVAAIPGVSVDLITGALKK